MPRRMSVVTKPFKCITCSYSTDRKYNLGIHLRTQKHIDKRKDIDARIKNSPIKLPKRRTVQKPSGTMQLYQQSPLLDPKDIIIEQLKNELKYTKSIVERLLNKDSIKLEQDKVDLEKLKYQSNIQNVNDSSLIFHKKHGFGYNTPSKQYEYEYNMKNGNNNLSLISQENRLVSYNTRIDHYNTGLKKLK